MNSLFEAGACNGDFDILHYTYRLSAVNLAGCLHTETWLAVWSYDT